MATTTKFKANTVLWTDLMCRDVQVAKKFYSELFGWQTMDVPTGGDGQYTMLSLENESLGAMAPMDEEMRAGNVPPHWTAYIYVENLEATMDSIRQHGGQVMCGPMDVMTHGKMACCMDPQGATFNIWQPIEHFGGQRNGKMGGLAWVELMSSDIEAALKFYGSVFGWTTTAMKMGEMTYHMVMAGENPVGGAMCLPSDNSENPMPSCWAVYFQVESVPAMMEKAQQLGAKVHMPETPVPGMGSFAFMSDPEGGLFYFWANAAK